MLVCFVSSRGSSFATGSFTNASSGIGARVGNVNTRMQALAVSSTTKPTDFSDAASVQPQKFAPTKDLDCDGELASLVISMKKTTLSGLCREAERMGLESPGHYVARMLESSGSKEDWSGPDSSIALFSQGQREKNVGDHAPFLLVTSRRPRLSGVLTAIRQQSELVQIVPDLEQACYRVQSARWTCLVIDIDSQGALASAIDSIIQIRNQRPNLPIILISALVKQNDFDLERLPLCDVTLRLPVAAEDFLFAVEEAKVNNRIWIARRRSQNLCRIEATSVL